MENKTTPKKHRLYVKNMHCQPTTIYVKDSEWKQLIKLANYNRKELARTVRLVCAKLRTERHKAGELSTPENLSSILVSNTLKTLRATYSPNGAL